MTKKYIILLNVITVLLGVVLVISNVYPLIIGEELFSNHLLLNDILFIALFTTIGIEKFKAKDKYGHIYLAFPLVMAIIILLKYTTKI